LVSSFTKTLGDILNVDVFLFAFITLKNDIIFTIVDSKTYLRYDKTGDAPWRIYCCGKYEQRKICR